jgi:hypothetical protein
MTSALARRREPGSRGRSRPGPDRAAARRVTLRVASTLYEGLFPVALFDALEN